ncbi:CHAT domain-containing protein [Coprinopsis sp. MPI-PUGE-AT-0042]|nr:CHAT domain-containing protein [Coprinopsis sp. MPI-PUGE-AT-0042]
MQDPSSFNRTGRWFLSWRVEVVDVKPRSSPIPNRPDPESAAGFDSEGRNAIVGETSLPGHVQYRTGLEEHEFRLTDVAVTYTPDDDAPNTVSAEVANIVLCAADQDWSLTLASSASNCWKVEGEVTIAMPQEMEGMSVFLTDSNLQHVALAFISLKQIFEVGTKASDTDCDSNGCLNEVELRPQLGPAGTWRVSWKIEHSDTQKARDEALHKLFKLLNHHFLESEDPKDLEVAILVGNEALSLAPKSFESISIALLASLHFHRYQKVTIASDLDNEIILQRRLLDSTSPNIPSYANYLGRLTSYLCARVATSNLENDVDEAMALASKGSSLIHQDRDHCLLFKWAQAFVLHRKFQLNGNIDHLNDATSVLLHLQCHPSSQLTSHLGNLLAALTSSYGDLFSTSGHAEYLHRIAACAYKHIAISNTPIAYCELGQCLWSLYSLSGSRRDLEGAIQALSIYIQMSETAGDDPNPDVLLDMSLALTWHGLNMPEPDMAYLPKAREFLLRVLSDSKEHEEAHERAVVELILNRAFQFCFWCNHYYRAGKDVEPETLLLNSELNQGLAEVEGLIRRVSPGSPFYPMGRGMVSYLRMAHAMLHNNRQHMDDIIEQEESLDHTDTPLALRGWLGRLCAMSGMVTGDLRYRELAFQEDRLKALDMQQPVLVRLQMAKEWVNHCGEEDIERSLEAYDVAIGILAMTAGLGQRISERHRHVTEPAAGEGLFGGKIQAFGATLASEAAARAVRCGRIDKALEWLEQGRCIVWNQLQTLRTPLDTLEQHDSRLARRISAVSMLLEDDGTERIALGEALDLDTDAKIALAEDSAKRARLSNEWDELLNQARNIPGFEDFLRPTRCSTLLQHLPESGPVVILNADELRCDAIVLLSGMDRPLLVPLRKMSYSRAKSMQQGLKTELAAGGLRMREALQEKFEEEHGVGIQEDEHNERGAAPKRDRPAMERILRELWESVVKPVLEVLGFNTKLATPTTRIWWCPTGPFSFLPIHAAGIYAPGPSSECLADYAVSSYTPTVSALAARIREKEKREKVKGRILLVSVPEAEGQKPIHGTTREIQALCDFATISNANYLSLDGKEATTERVMKEISKASIVHLACHGSQNITDPMKSGFFLQDKRLELSAIIKANLKSADLAFLSACQTGTGDENLSNEAVHLAAGMLAAGFRGTVATMWAISDAYAPKVAGDFYKDLLKRGREEGGGIDGENAAYALHRAIQELKKIPMKNFGGVEKWFLTWVPYVHYGL